MDTPNATHFRLAGPEDMDELGRLINLSIQRYIGELLDPAQLQASFVIMGLDSALIDDGTYYVCSVDGRIAGCGGWSRRATLFGANHTAGRDARLLDPKTEPARIRAMYTHPEFGRRGIARQIFALCSAAARAEGFRSLELMSTVAGTPLYQTLGFTALEQVDISQTAGVSVPGVRMRLAIA